MPASDIVAVAFAATSASRSVVNQPCVLHGFALAEAGVIPAAAKVRLRDGSATGTVLATVSLAASESVRDALPGLRVSTGVYLEVASGTVEGTVWVR